MVGGDGLPPSAAINNLAQRWGRNGAPEAQKVFSAPPSTLPNPDASATTLQATIDAMLQSRRRERGAANSTLEAVLYALRSYGIDTFKRPNCRRMLGDLSDNQLAQVIERLIKLRSQYPAIAGTLLTQLARLSS